MRDSLDKFYDPRNATLEEGDKVAVTMVEDPSGGQHAVMIPQSMRRKLNEEGLLIASDLQDLVLTIDALQTKLENFVEEARDAGMSWATIGWLCGLTAEGARKKWSDPSE